MESWYWFLQTVPNPGACQLQAMFDRLNCPPWCVAGGHAAKPGRMTNLKKSGERRIIYRSKVFLLEAGDKIIVETGGGGGYGAPHERPRELIERDLRRGCVSVADESERV
jgi:N-methylhydantoinase B